MTRCIQCTCRDCGNTIQPSRDAARREVAYTSEPRLVESVRELQRHNADLRGAIQRAEFQIGLGAVDILTSFKPSDHRDNLISETFPGFSLTVKANQPDNGDDALLVWVVRPCLGGSLFERFERAATRLMEAAYVEQKKEDVDSGNNQTR